MIDVKFGERQTYEFISEDGSPSPIVDYIYLPTSVITEKSAERDIVNKEVLLTLHEDRSVAMSTIETGKKLLWFEFAEEHIGPEDIIVDILPGAQKDDYFFALLTKKGKLLIYHYEMIESVARLKKYFRHLKEYD